VNQKRDEWSISLLPRTQFADGPIPYNVIDSKGLRDKLKQLPDRTAPLPDQIDHVRNLIQQASAKKSDLTKGTGKNRQIDYTRGFDVKPKYSSYYQRVKTTPATKGKWSSERAESLFISDKTGEIKKYLDEAGVDGVEYKNGMPDFSPFSKGEIKLENITNDRKSNFSSADEELAKNGVLQIKNGQQKI
jgi:hypothetical protein